MPKHLFDTLPSMSTSKTWFSWGLLHGQGQFCRPPPMGINNGITNGKKPPQLLNVIGIEGHIRTTHFTIVGLKLSKNQAWWISNDICHECGIGSNNFNPPLLTTRSGGLKLFFPNPTLVNSGGLNLLLPIPHSSSAGNWNCYSQSHTRDQWGIEIIIHSSILMIFFYFSKQQELQW